METGMSRGTRPTGVSKLDDKGVGDVRIRRVARGRKRTVEERETDLAIVAKLYIKGRTHYEIMEAINAANDGVYTLSIDVIGADVAEILLRWQRTYMGAIEELRGRQLASLDRCEAVLWEAYERSTQDRVKTEDLVYRGDNHVAEENEENSPSQDVGRRDGYNPIDFGVLGEAGSGVGQSAGGVGEPPARNSYGQFVHKDKPRQARPGKAGSQSQSKSFTREKHSEKRETAYGDVQIIEEIRRIVETRARILGLIVNQSKVTVNWRKRAEEEGLNPDELLGEVVDRIVDGSMRDIEERKS